LSFGVLVTPKDVMELVKIMQPADVKLSDLSETMYGNIELQDENGQWKVRRQKWSNTKP
jgi:hypothetical protein